MDLKPGLEINWIATLSLSNQHSSSHAKNVIYYPHKLVKSVLISKN